MSRYGWPSAAFATIGFTGTLLQQGSEDCFAPSGNGTMHRQLKMTFPDYLARLEKANPRLLAATDIKMTPAALIEQIQRAYHAGANHDRGGGGSLFDEIFPSLHKKGKP